MSDNPPAFPLSSLEKQAKTHALLCSIGFLVLLPIGVLLARYTRTFTTKWFYAHWLIQFLIAGPIIFAGWALGYDTANMLSLPHFQDPHQKVGLTLLILYLAQLVIGASVHFFKFPSLFRGHRAPHNYLHAMVGIAIFILAAYQVHYGLYTEWQFATGGLHVVPQSAKVAWMALIIVFWALFVLGLALLPHQLKQEQQMRKQRNSEASKINGSG